MSKVTTITTTETTLSLSAREVVDAVRRTNVQLIPDYAKVSAGAQQIDLVVPLRITWSVTERSRDPQEEYEERPSEDDNAEVTDKVRAIAEILGFEPGLASLEQISKACTELLLSAAAIK